MSSVLQLDILAAIARKNYEDRRNRQMQGIARAKTEGKYAGCRMDTEKRKIIASLLKSRHSYSEIQATVKCSRQLIAVIAKEAKKYSKNISLIVKLLLIKLPIEEPLVSNCTESF